jgi:chromosome partitioning protein
VDIVSFISQKGGVGKSTLARLLAVHAAHKGMKVMIADFDLEQLSCVEWSAQRMRNGIEPEIDARPFKSLKKLRKLDVDADLVIVDTRGLADDLTKDISEESDLVLLPTGTSMDDLRPTLALARKLGRSTRLANKIHLVLSKVGRSDRQLSDAKAMIEEAGFPTLAAIWPHRDGFAAELDAGRAGSEVSNPYLKATAESVELQMFKLICKPSEKSEA